MDGDAETSLEWWTLQQAAQETGLTAETMRLWARHDENVRSREVSVGKRTRLHVSATDVRLKASVGRGPTGLAKGLKTWPNSGAGAVDRIATLEEVARRYRLIDEIRDEIADRERQIAGHHRDIETFLLGPVTVPEHS